ncbi:HepT-like ribonuclease domain-containing protein [Actinomycetaceae bacterium MB13-C1-2]|nr:HepT-like ribonuclease domain-containing protein [Actinomycetaceae bacterium MB13-C1-2]
MTEVELFEEALVQLAKILEYSKRNLEDEVVVDAIALRLATMIDTLSRLSELTLMESFGENWKLMRGMRNRIAHGYMTVDPEAVAATVQKDLPQIESAIRSYLSDSA